MNRIAAITTAAAIAGATLLAPAVASADPSISFTGSSGSGESGQSITLEMTGCMVNGAPGYAGEFVQPTDDPDAPLLHFETLADEVGTATSVSTLPELSADMHLTVNWSCSSGPITEMSGPGSAGLEWLSPPLDYTIHAMAEPQALRAAARTAGALPAGGTSIAAGSTTGVVTVEANPNALPLVDKIGIVGAKAAAIKRNTDSTATAANRLKVMIARIFNRNVTSLPITNADYVEAAFAATGARTPTSAVAKTYTARLDAGALRVSVVEDIALRTHDAAWWNKR